MHTSHRNSDTEIVRDSHTTCIQSRDSVYRAEYSHNFIGHSVTHNNIFAYFSITNEYVRDIRPLIGEGRGGEGKGGEGRGGTTEFK